MSQSLDVLWGAVVEQVDLDLACQTLTINCRVVDNANVTRYRLKFTEISELRFFNSTPGPWEYAEMTEIHVNVTPAGKVQAEIVLWSESAELVAVAGSVELDGKSSTSPDLAIGNQAGAAHAGVFGAHYDNPSWGFMMTYRVFDVPEYHEFLDTFGIAPDAVSRLIPKL